LAVFGEREVPLQEETMPKSMLLIAATAVCALSIPLADRAQAGALAGAEGLRPALDEMSVTEKVHCRRGRVHHRGWPHDGCSRAVYRAPAYPYYGYGYGPYAYGYPYGYGPGVRVGIGRPWGWGGWGPGVGIGFGW
jgi:hypothetical protein